MDYRQETEKKTRWTKHHLEWLQSRSRSIEIHAAKLNLQILIKQFDDVTKNIELYQSEIEHIAEKDRYARKVKVLSAFKGVKQETALILIAELGDIRRFDHSRRLAQPEVWVLIDIV